MPHTAIRSLGETLATQSIALAQDVPAWLLSEERVPPWLNLSLSLVYLSFGKHWLPFLPAPEVAKAVDKCMDECFFDFVEHTTFELRAGFSFGQIKKRASAAFVEGKRSGLAESLRRPTIDS